jgi:hypothetical protein
MMDSSKPLDTQMTSTKKTTPVSTSSLRHQNRTTKRGVIPRSSDEMASLMLKHAGLSIEEGGRLLKLALMKAEVMLEATKASRVNHQGEFTDERVDSDNKAQLEATKVITTILGQFLPNKRDAAESKGKGDISVNINLPNWFEKEAPTVVVEASQD